MASPYGPGAARRHSFRNAGREALNTVFAGVWYKRPNLLYIEVEVAGGDGAGYAGSHLHSPQAGGIAGRAIKIIQANLLPSTVVVTVGGATGTSSFGSFLSATGGGNGGVGVEGAAGAGSGGDVNIDGMSGGVPVQGNGRAGYVKIREVYSS